MGAGVQAHRGGVTATRGDLTHDSQQQIPKRSGLRRGPP